MSKFRRVDRRPQWPLAAPVHRLVLRYIGTVDEVRTRLVCKFWNETSQNHPGAAARRAIELLKANEASLRRLLAAQTKTQLVLYWADLGGTKGQVRSTPREYLAAGIRDEWLQREQHNERPSLHTFLHREWISHDHRLADKHNQRILSAHARKIREQAKRELGSACIVM